MAEQNRSEPRSVNTRDEIPTRDRDQSAVSAERSHRVAERAETAATRPTPSSSPDAASALANRDNLQGADTGQTQPAGAATTADRRQRVAERAYYKAERRGFAAGQEEIDWLEAEKEQDAEDRPATRGSP